MAWVIDATALKVMRAIPTYTMGVKVSVRAPPHTSFVFSNSSSRTRFVNSTLLLINVDSMHLLLNRQTSTSASIHPCILAKVFARTPMETTHVYAHEELTAMIQEPYTAPEAPTT